MTKHLILATAAALSLASGSSVLAARPQVKLQQLAASGKPNVQTDAQSVNYALDGLSVQATAQRGTQFAAGGGNHPAANTDAQGTQLAAGGGNHPISATDVPSVQLAASGFQYVQRSHGEII
jgi:hypothetical protein